MEIDYIEDAKYIEEAEYLIERGYIRWLRSPEELALKIKRKRLEEQKHTTSNS